VSVPQQSLFHIVDCWSQEVKLFYSKIAVCCVVVSILAACGGGGGGGSGSDSASNAGGTGAGAGSSSSSSSSSTAATPSALTIKSVTGASIQTNAHYAAASGSVVSITCSTDCVVSNISATNASFGSPTISSNQWSAALSVDGDQNSAGQIVFTFADGSGNKAQVTIDLSKPVSVPVSINGSLAQMDSKGEYTIHNGDRVTITAFIGSTKLSTTAPDGSAATLSVSIHEISTSKFDVTFVSDVTAGNLTTLETALGVFKFRHA
jgi:hypothetical protein